MTHLTPIVETKKVLNGRWTKSEHDRFMTAFEKFGRNWVEVQKIVKTRNLTQVRSHAQKVFLNKGKNGVEEDFETEFSEQISYQDESDDESIKKEKREKKMKQVSTPKKQLDIIESLLPLVEQTNDKSSEGTKEEFNKDEVEFGLPSQEYFSNYFNMSYNTSYFMTCLAYQRDYFLNGGNFIHLCNFQPVWNNN